MSDNQSPSNKTNTCQEGFSFQQSQPPLSQLAVTFRQDTFNRSKFLKKVEGNKNRQERKADENREMAQVEQDDDLKIDDKQSNHNVTFSQQNQGAKPLNSQLISNYSSDFTFPIPNLVGVNQKQPQIKHSKLRLNDQEAHKKQIEIQDKIRILRNMIESVENQGRSAETSGNKTNQLQNKPNIFCAERLRDTEYVGKGMQDRQVCRQEKQLKINESKYLSQKEVDFETQNDINSSILSVRHISRNKSLLQVLKKHEQKLREFKLIEKKRCKDKVTETFADQNMGNQPGETSRQEDRSSSQLTQMNQTWFLLKQIQMDMKPILEESVPPELSVKNTIKSGSPVIKKLKVKDFQKNIGRQLSVDTLKYAPPLASNNQSNTNMDKKPLKIGQSQSTDKFGQEAGVKVRGVDSILKMRKLSPFDGYNNSFHSLSSDIKNMDHSQLPSTFLRDKKMLSDFQIQQKNDGMSSKVRLKSKEISSKDHFEAHGNDQQWKQQIQSTWQSQGSKLADIEDILGVGGKESGNSESEMQVKPRLHAHEVMNLQNDEQNQNISPSIHLDNH